MNRSEAILFHHSLGNQNRILEVVSVPGHKRDAHILTECQLAHIDGRTIGENIAPTDGVSLFHQRSLADAGILVRTGVLGEVVDIHSGVSGVGFFIEDTDDDSRRINTLDDAATEGDDTNPGVPGYIALHTGTYQGLLSL